MAAEQDPALKQLTDQFVRVRVVQMGGVDLGTFQFDPMLSWSIFFMNADKTIYGRYGRAHPQTKRAKKDSNPNPTKQSLAAALEGALTLHAAYTADAKTVGKQLAGKTGKAPRWRFAEKTPAALKYGRLKRVNDGGDGCVHCHEVLRTAIDSYFMSKIRVPDDHLWLYPRPHVIGLEMSNTASATITRVEPESLAATAGLEAGDEITHFGGQPLLSVADMQWVLHTMPDKGGDITVVAKRAGLDRLVKGLIVLGPGWRQTEDFAWRYRMAGYAAWLWGGMTIHDHPEGGVRVGRPAPRWFKKSNRDAMRVLKPGDRIVAVDNKVGMDRSEYLAYLMRDKRLGTRVRLRLLRGDESVEVSFKIPKKQPEVQGH